jgi:hypothetical protein
MFHAGINPTQLSGYNKESLGTTIQQDAYDRARGGAASPTSTRCWPS